MSYNASNFFRFCPRCGAKLSVKRVSHASRLVCGQCGFVFYQNPKPCTGAFIEDKDGRILLVKRAVDPQKGYWDVPGGFIETGENPIVATKREIREELGVTVRVTGLLGVYTDTYFYRYQMSTLNFGFRASITGGRLRPMSDTESYEWFARNKIPWRRLAFHWITPALKDWMKNRK